MPRDRLFGDAWQPMWGMGNRSAHGYLNVDADIVRVRGALSPGYLLSGSAPGPDHPYRPNYPGTFTDIESARADMAW